MEMKFVLDSLGDWPVLERMTGGQWNESEFDLETDLVQLRTYGLRTLVNMDVELDSRDTNRKILRVGTLSSSLSAPPSTSS